MNNPATPAIARSTPRFSAVITGLIIALPVLALLVNSGASAPLALLAIAGTVMLVLHGRPRLSPDERLLVGVLAIFVASILVALIASGATRDAVRMLDVLLLRPLFAIPLLFLLVTTRPPEGALWFGVTLGAIAAGINGIYEVLIAGTTTRAGGATNPIIYGNLALAMGFMSLAGLSYFKALGHRYLLLPILGISLGICASLLSGTRGGWLALPILLLVLSLGLLGTTRRLPAIAAATSIAILIAIGALWATSSDVSERIDRAHSEFRLYIEDPAQHGNTSVGVRLELWRAAFDMFKEQPLLGGGLGESYNAFLQERIEAGDYHEHAAQYKHAHNEVLMTLATRGVAGTLALLALWLIPGWIFLRALRADNPSSVRRLGLTGLLLVTGYLVFGLTEAIMHRGPPLTFFCFFAALLVYLISEQHRRQPQHGNGVSGEAS